MEGRWRGGGEEEAESVRSFLTRSLQNSALRASSSADGAPAALSGSHSREASPVELDVPLEYSSIPAGSNIYYQPREALQVWAWLGAPAEGRGRGDWHCFFFSIELDNWPFFMPSTDERDQPCSLAAFLWPQPCSSSPEKRSG